MPVTRHMIRQPLVIVPVATPPPFSPPSVAGLFAWFDASNAASITASGGAVSQWNDLSGNGRNVTQGTGANQPTTGTRTMNGLNVIDFDGVNDSLGNAAGMNQPITLVMAFLAEANGGNIALHNGAQFLRKGGQWKLYAGGSEIGGGTPDAFAHVGSAVFNTSSSQLWVDGVSIVTGDPGNSSTSGLTFGTDAGFAFFDGVLAEVTVYAGVLSSTDRQAVEGYLAKKWGLTPLSIAGLVAWLDAADTATITQSGGAVSQWASKDSGAKVYPQATGAEQPRTGTTTLNGRNVIDFDVTDWDVLDRFSNDLDFTSGGFTTFAVVNTASGTNGVYWTTQIDPFSGGAGWFLDRGVLSLMQSPGVSAGAGDAATIPTGWDYYTTRSDPAGPLSITRTNGVQNPTTTTTVGHAALAGAHQLVGNYRLDSTIPLNGSIAEFLVYNNALSNSNILTIEAYLKTKWGL